MKGTEVYDKALDLLGIRLGNGGEPSTALDLKARSVSLINILIAENRYLDNIIKNTKEQAVYINDLNDEVTVHDKLTGGVFPFGLASMLIYAEDRELAGVMQSRYLGAIHRVRSELPALQLEINDEYGGTEW